MLPALPAFASKEASEPEEPSVFADGPFAKNVVANLFKAPLPGISLPKSTPILGPKGSPRSLDAYRGKTILLSLWAEWCVPCVMEIPVFDKIAQLYNSDTFALVPVMSGTQLDNTTQVKPFLTKIGAATFPLFMDGSSNHDNLARTLARPNKGRGFALPCNLLIDPTGAIRGRDIGGKTFKNERGEFSIWASTDSVAFLKALSAGLLAPADPAKPASGANA